MFARRRPRFQHRIVDADIFALRIQPAKSVGKLARAKAGGNFFQDRRGLRKMLAQRISQRARAPQKHAAVPEIISRSHKSRSLLRVWLLGKSAHAQRVSTEFAARFNVTVPGLRSIRPDTEHNNILASSRGLHPAFDSRAITLFIGA